MIQATTAPPLVLDSPPPPAPAKRSAKDLIGSLAKKPSGGKKKDEKPQVHDPALDDVITSYIEQKRAMENAEALANAAKDQIVSTVGPARLARCVSENKVIASIGVNGRLTFTQTCRYSTVSEERADALAEAFGDLFDAYFRSTLKISLKEASANNEAVLDRLVEALGEDFFAEHFDVRRDLAVSDRFHNDYCTKADVQQTAQPFIDDQTIRPYAASLKIA